MIMNEFVIRRIYEYLSESEIDLLLEREDHNDLIAYVSKTFAYLKNASDSSQESYAAYELGEGYVEALLQGLKPLKFNYISNLLETEFEKYYYNFQQLGILQFEIINMISHCQPVFNAFGFSEENEDSREILNTVIGTINEYLEEKSKSEMKWYELQQEAKA